MREKFTELLRETDRLFPEASDPDRWPIHPDSSLAEDDRVGDPFMPSHTLIACIQACLEHFDALGRLLGGDNGALHIRADYTLVRSALEAAAMAHWILMPAERAERVTRCLRLSTKDARDSSSLAADDPSARRRITSAREDAVREVARSQGLDLTEVTKGITMTDLLRAVDQRTATESLKSWQLCAGMAHGRQWALLAMSDLKELAQDQASGVVTHHVSARLGLLFVCASDAYDLLTRVLGVFHGRRRAPHGYPRPAVIGGR